MKVLLRESCGVADATLVLAWRNNPLIWQGLYTQGKENRSLVWAEHWKWWKSRYTWKIFIIQVNDGETTRDVGYLNMAQLDHWRPEFGISIGEVGLWGQGVATQALLLGVEWLKEHGYRRVHTSIPKNNERAIKLFQSLGFKTMGDAREKELEVELWIS